MHSLLLRTIKPSQVLLLISGAQTLELHKKTVVATQKRRPFRNQESLLQIERSLNPQSSHRTREQRAGGSLRPR